MVVFNYFILIKYFFQFTRGVGTFYHKMLNSDRPLKKASCLHNLHLKNTPLTYQIIHTHI